MKKSTGLYLGIGLILVAITLVIFFVPNWGDERTALEYTKLGIILASQVILILNLIIVSSKANMFMVFGSSSVTMLWFFINLILTLSMRSMQTLITWTSVAFLIYLAIMLFTSFAGGTIGDDMVREKQLQEENKKKNLLNK